MPSVMIPNPPTIKDSQYRGPTRFITMFEGSSCRQYVRVQSTYEDDVWYEE